MLVLMAAQITHNLHSVDFWSPSRASMANKPLVNHPLPPQATHTHSPLTASPQPHSSSRSALHCGGGLRVVAVPSVLTHCQMRRSVRTALWPHSALWASHREVGRWPRCGALAQMRLNLSCHVIHETCCNGKRTVIKATQSPFHDFL